MTLIFFIYLNTILILLINLNITLVLLIHSIPTPGYRTVIMASLSEIYYKDKKKTASSIISQIRSLPEQKMEDYLTEGLLDAGFFYDCEYTWDDEHKFIPLPVLLDMSNSSLNYYYRKVRQGAMNTFYFD